MRGALEINIAIWGMIICASMGMAQYLFEIF
jgi:hypothetical protein